MFPDVAASGSVALANRAAIERRSHARYPIELDVRYNGSWKKGVATRVQVRLAILVREASFLALISRCLKGVTSSCLSTGRFYWKVCLLQLVITAKIVRSSRGGVAATVLNHKFRTRRRYAAPPASIVSDHSS
jgi:hypothetical protein